MNALFENGLEALTLVLVAVSVTGLVYYLGWLSLQAQYVILADGRRQERSLPLLLRAILPFSAAFPRAFTGALWKRSLEEGDRKIFSAGFDGLITGREILFARFSFALGGCVLGVFAAQGIHVLALVLLLCGLFYPSLWLRGAMMTRHKAIQRGLPFVLDLLTLCVEAGLDFMSAMARIIERRKMDALSEEMLRVFHAIKLGRTRRQALKEMRDRVGLSDLSVVINALIQADELGVSLGSILRIQSDQLRTKRFQRAETLANQAPTKLLLPLIGFIFPAVFIVLLGPVLLQMFHRGF